MRRLPHMLIAAAIILKVRFVAIQKFVKRGFARVTQANAVNPSNDSLSVRAAVRSRFLGCPIRLGHGRVKFGILLSHSLRHARLMRPGRFGTHCRSAYAESRQ